MANMLTQSDFNVQIHAIDRTAPDACRRVGELALAADRSLDAGILAPVQWYIVLYRLYTLIPS